jgi:hypothetical protein
VRVRADQVVGTATDKVRVPVPYEAARLSQGRMPTTIVVAGGEEGDRRERCAAARARERTRRRAGQGDGRCGRQQKRKAGVGVRGRRSVCFTC